ncbi:MAG: tetraacyldisaccharide 4'-kinase [Elusimicrobia bacterium]|nr:tetraacyldisaccharide 4'-kinase [Elusimicrobiota bacterium]
MRKIWQKLHKSALGRLSLRLLSYFYFAACLIRHWWTALFPHERAVDAFVISVGNLTVGGTGKTTMAAYLAEHFLRQGLQVCILTRGYKGADEARQLKRQMDVYGCNFHILVGANRYQLARDFFNDQRLTINDQPVFIMDDGHQHASLKKDISIVLIDAADDQGLSGLLPYGLLREPIIWGLKRADIIVLTHADLISSAKLSNLSRDILLNRPDLPVFDAAHNCVGFRLLGGSSNGSRIEPLDALKNETIALFSGIGNPAAFEALARRDVKAKILKHFVFEDHAFYDQKLLQRVLEDCLNLRIGVLMTTLKDAERLADGRIWPAGCPFKTPGIVWCALEVQWKFLSGEGEFWKIVEDKGTKGSGLEL